MSNQEKQNKRSKIFQQTRLQAESREATREASSCSSEDYSTSKQESQKPKTGCCREVISRKKQRDAIQNKGF